MAQQSDLRSTTVTRSVSTFEARDRTLDVTDDGSVAGSLSLCIGNHRRLEAGVCSMQLMSHLASMLSFCDKNEPGYW